MTRQPIYVDGSWCEADTLGVFHAENPATGETLPEEYPVSAWADCDRALNAAARVARELAPLPAEPLAAFLERYAQRIESHRAAIVERAHVETALPATPRLADVELPRTTNQLRQAAAAAREGSWALPTIDAALNIRSMFGPIGPVCVLGPNNFPLAFGSVSGGDFAAAIAAGNPVIAKANTSHPGTTRLLAEQAAAALKDVGLPPAAIQLLYRLEHADGERLVSDPRLGATAYTGSRAAGLRLKTAADKAGKPIYLELSSINPVVVLPGALQERGAALADEFTASCLMGTGQFCTNPGLVILLAGPATESFISGLRQRFERAPVGTLLSSGVQFSLEHSVERLVHAGAQVVTGNRLVDSPGYCFANTLLQVPGSRFLNHGHALQTEAFGNASLLVVADDLPQAVALLEQLDGNLCGVIYSAASGSDDEAAIRVAAALRPRVGRLLNDKMPTGVAVSPAMHHGGPYPATGHPGFTAVGIPGALRRFGMLQCYDNVRHDRLPAALQDKNPNGRMWRWIDGEWTRGDVPPKTAP